MVWPWGSEDTIFVNGDEAEVAAFDSTDEAHTVTGDPGLAGMRTGGVNPLGIGEAFLDGRAGDSLGTHLIDGVLGGTEPKFADVDAVAAIGSEVGHSQ